MGTGWRGATSHHRPPGRTAIKDRLQGSRPHPGRPNDWPPGELALRPEILQPQGPVAGGSRMGKTGVWLSLDATLAK